MNEVDKFKKAFWASFILAFALVLVPVLTVTAGHHIGGVAKPPYPVPGRLFVAEYGDVASDVAHDLYYWGLFGFGQRIRKADLLLLGSSHMQFGVSARRLSSELHVRAFNAGLGCAEGFGFDADILRRLDVRERAAIGDTYAYNADISACAASALNSDPLEAATHVATVWARFVSDWTLDGVLPAISINENTVEVERFLNFPVLMLDWQYGDVDYFGRRYVGEVFPDMAAPSSKVLTGAASELPWTFSLSRIAAPPALEQIAERQHLRLAFTLIPFSASLPLDRARYTDTELLTSKAARNEPPFFALSAEGLATFDYGHLVGTSRNEATRRLAVLIRESAWLKNR